MIAFAAILAVAGAAAPAEPTQTSAAQDTYRACAIDRARRFHVADLSGDPPEMLGYAAIYACNNERFAFVQALENFMRTRHPDLSPGSLAKTVAIFVEHGDVTLQDEIARIAATPAAGQGQE